jgi:hypothetical protein
MSEPDQMSRLYFVQTYILHGEARVADLCRVSVSIGWEIEIDNAVSCISTLMRRRLFEQDIAFLWRKYKQNGLMSQCNNNPRINEEETESPPNGRRNPTKNNN